MLEVITTFVKNNATKLGAAGAVVVVGYGAYRAYKALSERRATSEVPVEEIANDCQERDKNLEILTALGGPKNISPDRAADKETDIDSLTLRLIVINYKLLDKEFLDTCNRTTFRNGTCTITFSTGQNRAHFTSQLTKLA